MNTNFTAVAGLTRFGIKPESTAPEAGTFIPRLLELSKKKRGIIRINATFSAICPCGTVRRL